MIFFGTAFHFLLSVDRTLFGSSSLLCRRAARLTRWLGVIALLSNFAISSAYTSDSCNTGECKLKGNVSLCISEEAYDKLTKEFVRISETGELSREFLALYDQGLCARFLDGTRVEVVESGIFVVRVRFKYLNGYPDMWISPEMLETT